ncbi:vWA domain-containing protein [Nannocystaceae bacterium ST9]
MLPLACADSSAEGEGDASGPSTLTAEGTADEVGDSGESASGSESASDSGSDSSTGDGDDPGTSSDTLSDTTETTAGDTTETTTGETTTADSTTDATTESTSTTMDIPCDEFAVTLDPLPPNVMLVLDKSRSMFINYWDHDNNANTPTITRWNSLHQVTDDIVTNFDDKIRFGSILFPSTSAQNVYGPAACITSDFPDVTVGPFNGPAILASIPAANAVNSYGGTPAATGIQTAYDHLQGLGPDVPRAMILVTDGAANCSQSAQTNFDLFEVYDTSLPTLVATAHADGIDTYVVGVDIANMVVNDGVGGDPNNINPSQKLNEVAAMGGTGSFFNSQDQVELEAALNDVIDSVKTCIIPLSEEPVFPEFTKVLVGNMEWPMVDDCASENGWHFSNPYDTIELCGTACDALKDAGDADIQYFCNPG